METHPSKQNGPISSFIVFFVVVVEEIESRHSSVTTYSIYSKWEKIFPYSSKQPLKGTSVGQPSLLIFMTMTAG